MMDSRENENRKKGVNSILICTNFEFHSKVLTLEKAQITFGFLLV